MVWIKSDSLLEKNPKFFELMTDLNLGKRDVFWILHHLWFWSAEYYPDGMLVGVSEASLAHATDWTREPKALAEALEKTGFLDRIDSGWKIHDWDSWKSDPTRLRVRRTSDKRPTNVGSPQQTVSSVVVLSFPVSGIPKDWLLREDYLNTLKDLYPGVDVFLESKKALNWVQTNPTRMKTSRGMPKFLAGWMERCQNRGGKYSPKTSAEKDAEFDAEMNRIQEAKKKNDGLVEAYLGKK